MRMVLYINDELVDLSLMNVLQHVSDIYNVPVAVCNVSHNPKVSERKIAEYDLTVFPTILLFDNDDKLRGKVERSVTANMLVDLIRDAYGN